ncbi:MAG TPA: alpha/beta hydrolase [Phenylobacterium sp.]
MIDTFTYGGADGWPLFCAKTQACGAMDRGSDLPVVLLHGGGPDHESLLPLAGRLSHRQTIWLPDSRGYGRSVCPDASRHTWSQYASDLIALLDHIGVERAAIGGAGLGGTIALRAALAHPDRIGALILMSVEDIEDDDAKAAEIVFMDEFAARVRERGIDAGWAPILPDLAPVIGTMVRDAIPRSDAASLAAAAAIGYDRAFRHIEELAAIEAPTLIFPGMDNRHPAAVAEHLSRLLPSGRLAALGISDEIRTAEDFADAFAPAIGEFLASLRRC